MRTVQTTFSKVPVGGFFFMQCLRPCLVKVSRRRAVIGPTRMDVYEPSASTVVFVLA